MRFVSQYLAPLKRSRKKSGETFGACAEIIWACAELFWACAEIVRRIFQCKNKIKIQPFGSNNPVMMNSGRLIFHILGWPRKHLFGNIWEGSLSGASGWRQSTWLVYFRKGHCDAIEDFPKAPAGLRFEVTANHIWPKSL